MFRALKEDSLYWRSVQVGTALPADRMRPARQIKCYRRIPEQKKRREGDPSRPN